ncbi:hypothetical protein SERLA73DRAFT_174859 [Serpula lacrymans var. lacrymans S7.3]|uniref:Uncharacterized protein n=2 Tax=Serpula lacrymans var. lacrymans TaxID=341189 RepID=F8PIM0_SERL3|nr:uncharacterized protein SERLADRAFT_456543 [Serpula lacrymans var. lacrymans S7.9]EGO03391.1 hypothetical protein SERLA73DRAFT_174859 [Serpula lacrymans var. lacrymans S7.3]EGO29162.1 hypothetical protein SERLADRAFT_456543 [Serpula lacrymans var. lacrymans S7.9]
MAGPSKVNKTATAKSMKATVEDIVEETDDEWSKIPVEEAEPVPEIKGDDIDVEDSGEASWYGAGEGGYWSGMAGGTIPEVSSEQEPKHVRWMPPSMVSDIEPRFTPNAAANMFDAGDGDDMEREVFYYALSGGAFTTDGFSAPGVPSYPEDDQTESPGIDFSSAFQAGFPDFGNKGQKSEDVKPVVGKGKGKERSRQESSFGTKKAQETPWPSMETWMSASSRMGGQSSGSARFL